MRWRLLRALLYKNSMIWLRSGFRVADFLFFPAVDLAVWGFVTVYMTQISHAIPGTFIFLLSAIIFWTVQFRAQQVISLAILDDIESRNLLNMFISPVRIFDYMVACYLVGFVQALFVFVMQMIIAYFAFSSNFSVLSLSCAVLFLNLLFTGWSLGLFTCGLLIRFGHSAATLIWVLPFFMQPLTAVFYPVAVLPQWLQIIALSLPPTHVFEGMRQVIATGHMDWYHLQWAFLLNIIYMVLAGMAFHMLFEESRKNGSLTKYST